MDRLGVETVLNRDRLRVLEAFGSVPPHLLDRPVTRSEHDPNLWWSPKDHFSHLIRLERYFVALIGRFLDGETVTPVPAIDGDQRVPDPVAAVHRVNEEFAATHRDASLDELLRSSEETRAELFALLARVEPGAFDLVVPGAPWADGTVGALLLHNTGEHFNRHWNWLNEGLARSGEPESTDCQS